LFERIGPIISSSLPVNVPPSSEISRIGLLDFHHKLTRTSTFWKTGVEQARMKCGKKAGEAVPSGKRFMEERIGMTKSYELHGIRILECAAQGAALRTFQELLAETGEELEFGNSLIVVPAVRFVPEFFQLQTGLAGEIFQKIVNYRLRLAIIGDIAQWIAASAAFRDLVRESNRGNTVWFLRDRNELEQKVLVVH
jgi:hypothetical protein